MKTIIDINNKTIKNVEITEEEKTQLINENINSNKIIKIAELKEYLNITWRWKNERHNAELEEIKLGLRETTTQTTEELILDRKEKVDEINSLES